MQKEIPTKNSKPMGGGETFILKEYGRIELARLYCPYITPDAAWKKLRRWIRLCPGLTDKLASAGYTEHVRSFTPAQVRLIAEAIGEP